MFTGIVEHVGRVEALDKSAVGKDALDKSAVEKGALEGALETGTAGGRLRVHAGPLAASLAVSGSIAVNGCCLTIVEISGEVFAADLSSETLRRTSFAEIKAGTRVNLERLARYVAMKGSIAIDGISLTVANIAGDTVEAAIIPFTYANTNLQALRVGDAVNLEADILAKYLERLLEARRPAASAALSVERLVEEGF